MWCDGLECVLRWRIIWNWIILIRWIIIVLLVSCWSDLWWIWRWMGWRRSESLSSAAGWAGWRARSILLRLGMNWLCWRWEMCWVGRWVCGKIRMGIGLKLGCIFFSARIRIWWICLTSWRLRIGYSGRCIRWFLLCKSFWESLCCLILLRGFLCCLILVWWFLWIKKCWVCLKSCRRRRRCCLCWLKGKILLISKMNLVCKILCVSMVCLSVLMRRCLFLWLRFWILLIRISFRWSSCWRRWIDFWMKWMDCKWYFWMVISLIDCVYLWWILLRRMVVLLRWSSDLRSLCLTKMVRWSIWLWLTAILLKLMSIFLLCLWMLLSVWCLSYGLKCCILCSLRSLRVFWWLIFIFGLIVSWKTLIICVFRVCCCFLFMLIWVWCVRSIMMKRSLCLNLFLCCVCWLWVVRWIGLWRVIKKLSTLLCWSSNVCFRWRLVWNFLMVLVLSCLSMLLWRCCVLCMLLFWVVISFVCFKKFRLRILFWRVIIRCKSFWVLWRVWCWVVSLLLKLLCCV